MTRKVLENTKKVIKLYYSRNLSSQIHQFVPKHNPVDKKDVKNLEKFILGSNKLVVLTGAGISTESGIPDYRSEEVGLYARTNHKPIQYMEFLKSAATRQRYWARNFVGWHKFSQCQPNQIHFFLRDLEVQHKKISVIVTQNVDSLHFKAGSRHVVELHGTAYTVICLECPASYDRHYIQDKLMKQNYVNFEETTRMVRPDGDVDIPEEFINNFTPPVCDSCNGVLKPDIIFFGDNVPRDRMEHVRECISSSDGLLILGSSLSVFSGYRIVLQAVEENKNICIVNIGPTRADHLVKLKISAKCGDILPKIC